MKILFVVNEASFFLSHRLPLAQEALARNLEVVVASAANTGEQRLAEHGISHVAFPMTRSGFNPLEEWRTLVGLRRIYQTEKPDIVHHVTIKPVLYGTQAARLARVPAVVNAVPGMGFVFTRRGLVAAMRRAMVNLLYRVSLSHRNMWMIFQNHEDMRGFINHAIVDRHRSTLIRGSGVDLQTFCSSPEPDGPVTFLLVGRMLRDKGVREYVKAARLVRKVHPDWRFKLLGDVDAGNPSTVRREQLEAWEREYGVEWLGQRDDVSSVMSACHIVCLPSYREGLPKTLLEAAASARAMIASDVAGCREVVTDGVNGLIVPPREVESLASAMCHLGEDPVQRHRFAKAARDKAEAVFSVQDVVAHTFRVYERLLN